ncbi:hypothetical protein D5F01_LYC25026 [Larimichthys crocea]|uniref:Uncharacterized protein n=1 Tax=Larimichthys crocea TaxID=215358 RepID=A0A6G0HDR8_LARCR|nr:hypothetical protein D5F01_LYC25026 [Larimichthys crocea]
MDHLRPSSLHPSLGRAWLQRASLRLEVRGLITVTLHTHAHTGRHRGSRRGALTWITSGPAACTHRWAELAPESLPPAGGHRGLITVTHYTRTHTQADTEEAEGGPDMDHLRPSSLHPSLGRAGSREPPSGWRSQGPDHSHTTHARTHRQTQRKQEGALTWITSGPAACTHRWAELAPESLPPAGGHRGLITVTLHTHAHTGRHRGSRRGP